MSGETEPGALPGSSRKPRYDPTISLGQIVTIIPLVMAGIGAYYGLRGDAAVRDVYIETMRKEAIEQKQTTNAALSEIKGDVKAVANAVQTLSAQVTISQAVQQHQSRPDMKDRP